MSEDRVDEFTWADLLADLVARRDMDRATASAAMERVLSGQLTPVQVAGFAVALRAKGETADEIAGMADGMIDQATPVTLDRDAVDIVGTGGDRANTVNISTMAAIVAAAAGAKVVKHGNRSASSACGAADCLEALGVRVDIDPQRQAAVLDEVGIAFLFAPLYHASLRHAAPARKELGIQTTFNLLGPLTNPARPYAAAIGIADDSMAPLVAEALAARGTRGFVFHGEDGLDELTTTTVSQVWVLADGKVVETEIDPAALGLAPAIATDLVGGDPTFNARVVRKVLAGERGPVRDIVLLNAAAALLAYDGLHVDDDIAPRLAERLERVAQAIDSGAAEDCLDRWIAVTQD
ncbi:anthranilate phosphoribosyltransferase [Cutibacterium sp. WCA-380-WT-3A]|uniref:Anthranilate phosphoribosyltransferase n=1 Tax=Cutibacterium porci TaxID=2605781 RepID=A0A7K0J7C0_9ACTN|nr:anthranilate phosphoribosyltransferase [Cutibacterium porci]MSS45870.1 anthranilate phosphoribosyltransferase [Cutibacterium porci]